MNVNESECNHDDTTVEVYKPLKEPMAVRCNNCGAHI